MVAGEKLPSQDGAPKRSESGECLAVAEDWIDGCEVRCSAKCVVIVIG